MGLLFSFISWHQGAGAFTYPVFAQSAYEDPREATGKIVCANCHLGSKPIELKLPQAVPPDAVFEATVSIPYETTLKQVTATGSLGPLNVGAVVVLPEGFTIAPKARLSESEIDGSNLIQPYSKNKENILVVGPISGDKNQKITFPILSPDPSQEKNIKFLNYPIYVGGNRGRGQVYPSGEKTNNSEYLSTEDGKFISIKYDKKNKLIFETDTKLKKKKRKIFPRGEKKKKKKKKKS